MNTEQGSSAKTCLLIALATAIALLAGFVASAGGGSSAVSDAELGAAFGQGLFFTMVVWGIVHFVYLRKQSSKIKKIAGASIVISGIIGSVAGLLI